MDKSKKSVFGNKTKQDELVKLRKVIKETIHQERLKVLKKLVQRYFLMISPEAMEDDKAFFINEKQLI
jgi:hypothetical protein